MYEFKYFFIKQSFPFPFHPDFHNCERSFSIRRAFHDIKDQPNVHGHFQKNAIQRFY